MFDQECSYPGCGNPVEWEIGPADIPEENVPGEHGSNQMFDYSLSCDEHLEDLMQEGYDYCPAPDEK